MIATGDDELMLRSASNYNQRDGRCGHRTDLSNGQRPTWDAAISFAFVVCFALKMSSVNMNLMKCGCQSLDDSHDRRGVFARNTPYGHPLKMPRQFLPPLSSIFFCHPKTIEFFSASPYFQFGRFDLTKSFPIPISCSRYKFTS